MSFAENLKTLRKEKGLDQQELAQKLNVSSKTISHWETSYTEPSLAQLTHLADFFDVSLDDLLDRK